MGRSLVVIASHFLLSLLAAPSVAGFSSLLLSRRWRIPTHCQSSSESSSSSSVEDTSEDKRLFQRTFYRFSPGSDVAVHNSMVIEDRISYVEGENAAASAQRTILLRDGDVEDGEIGDEFFVTNSIPFQSQSPPSTAELVTALYLASNPNLVSAGTVLEMASASGWATLLGCVGAGHVLKREDAEDDSSLAIDDDILTIAPKKDKFLPPDLEFVSISSASDTQLQAIAKNCQQSGLSSTKVRADPLDWTARVRGRVPTEYTTIVAADVAFSFPEAKALARSVAYRLRPSWYDGEKTLTVPPRFVHVSPEAREDVAYLQRELTSSYKMMASSGYLKLEKLVFLPQALGASQDEVALDEMDLELGDFRELRYSSLVAQHHPEYAGEGSGELFFPADTGDYGLGAEASLM